MCQHTNSHYNHSLTVDSFPLLENEILVSEQGVYIGIVRTESGLYLLYVGSSYGQKGLINRINKNHRSPSYRKKYPDKTFYVAMDTPGSITRFIRLIWFPNPVPTGLVLLAEAVCCSLFGSYDHAVYHRARPHSLPAVDWNNGLNRSDPLKIWPSGPTSIGNDLCTFRRLRRLDNCLNSGPMKVWYCKEKDKQSGSYQFCLFNENFTIPSKIAQSWNLAHQSIVNVQWDAKPERHQKPFAPEAGDEDLGKGVGIRVFKMINGSNHEHWLQRRSKYAVKLANTLHDFLHGLIVGKDYKWEPSRRYIFQITNDRHDTEQATPSTMDRRPIHIPYPNHFVWDDGNRKPESKPLEEQRDKTQEQEMEIMEEQTSLNEPMIHKASKPKIEIRYDVSDFHNYYETSSDYLWPQWDRFRRGGARQGGPRPGFGLFLRP